jgi:hypothetical protein
MTDQNVDEPAAPVKAGDGDTAVAGETADQETPSFAEKLGQAARSIKQRFSGAAK